MNTSKVLSKDDLNAIEDRCRFATPPPWVSQLYDSDLWEVIPVACGQDYGVFERANTEFVARARVDIPALIAEIKRLQLALENKHE